MNIELALKVITLGQTIVIYINKMRCKTSYILVFLNFVLYGRYKFKEYIKNRAKYIHKIFQIF